MKTNETKSFKVKIWGGFDHYKRIKVFTIKFNAKSIANSNNNLLTRPRASSRSINSSLLGLTVTQAPTLVTLRSHSKVSDHLQLSIFVAATRFYQCLIVDLVSVDACLVRRYNTS